MYEKGGDITDGYFLARLKDLSKRSGYAFTDFLDLEEQSVLESNKHVLGKYTLFGGCDGTERNIARFVDSEEPGYEEDFPIVCLEILPKSEKFAEPLCHRDFLGALMNLGIERKNIGDISVMHKRAEHLTVLTDIFSPDTAADGLEICPILPSPSFLSRQKSVPLKLLAPKTDYFC